MHPIIKVCVVTPLLLLSLAAHSALTADEIMQKNFFASKPKQLLKEVTMTLVNERGEKRQRSITALVTLQPNGVDSNMLVRFKSPADVKGTSFLEIEHSDGDDDQWIYLPALHKSRRLVSSNRKDSFIGSDFSYGDVMPPKVSLYQHKLLSDEAVDGAPCYVIESVPANEDVKRDYGYAKKVTWIDKNSFHELKTVFYDVTGRLLKTQTVKGLVLIDPDTNRWAATYKEMVNNQTNHRTIAVAESHTTEAKVTDRTFSLQALERD